MKIRFGDEERIALTIWLGFIAGIVYGVGWAKDIQVIAFLGCLAILGTFLLLNEVYKMYDYALPY